MPEKLLSRDEFRVQTLARRGGLCAVCPRPAQDAHHILNRNLFTEYEEQGGYFLSNGAPLCDEHHLEAELTTITVRTLRDALNIHTVRMPFHLESGVEYDTWGNTIISPSFRRRGPLFEDEGCQKALGRARILWQFA